MEQQEALIKIICLLEQILQQLKDSTLDITQCICAVISCILAFIACVLAWFIPKRIMWEQTYSTLISDYRSYDFGIAVQGIVEFFTNDCKSDVKNIRREYERRFNEDIKEINERSPELCLHYQRRLLVQFYCQLDLCARSPFIGEKRVRRDFTKSEANLVQILFLMDKAIDESDILKKDISCDERIPRNAKGINRYLRDIYQVLKMSKPYMEM